jgi:hypothetical protein
MSIVLMTYVPFWSGGTHQGGLDTTPGTQSLEKRGTASYEQTFQQIYPLVKDPARKSIQFYMSFDRITDPIMADSR